jgi:HTH-type transcriptional regulator/antitoxin HigA
MTSSDILVRAIVTEDDHEWAIHRITALMDASPGEGSKEDYELDALLTLTDRYESVNFPMGTPSPVRFIQFMLEQKGLTRKDLEPMIGSRARVSEVLSGKRSLTLNMIRKLHQGLDIPAEYLLGPLAEPKKQVRRRALATPRIVTPKAGLPRKIMAHEATA